MEFLNKIDKIALKFFYVCVLMLLSALGKLYVKKFGTEKYQLLNTMDKIYPLCFLNDCYWVPMTFLTIRRDNGGYLKDKDKNKYIITAWTDDGSGDILLETIMETYSPRVQNIFLFNLHSFS